MFTGIIETLGKVYRLRKEGSNLHITVSTLITDKLKIDQSISHNGVCLTVVEKEVPYYTVTAIDETLQKTNLSELKEGQVVNLERALSAKRYLIDHGIPSNIISVNYVSAGD